MEKRQLLFVVKKSALSYFLTTLILIILHLGTSSYKLLDKYFLPEVVENQAFVVKEGISSGSIIGTIATTGTDTRGEINWQIISNVDGNENEQDAFRVDRHTGDLIVNDAAEFDYEIVQSFTITVIPGKTTEDVDPTSIIIQIENVNEFTPNAVEDGPIPMLEDEQVALTRELLLQNDYDLDGDSLFIVIKKLPINGSVVGESDGSFIYKPFTNYYGTDSLAYAASDGAFTSNEIWVKLIIDPVNDPPINTELTVNHIRENIIPGSKIGKLSSEDVEGDRVVKHELIDNPYFILSDDVLISKVVYNYEDQQEYVVKIKVTDERGATGENEVVIDIIDHYEAPLLYIPNLFTPNGDNNNDVFRIRGDEIMEISWIIYNHYGEVLFKTTNPETATGKGWNGYYNGLPAPTGTYTWQLQGKFLDGTPIRFNDTNTGQVTLIR